MILKKKKAALREGEQLLACTASSRYRFGEGGVNVARIQTTKLLLVTLPRLPCRVSFVGVCSIVLLVVLPAAWLELESPTKPRFWAFLGRAFEFAVYRGVFVRVFGFAFPFTRPYEYDDIAIAFRDQPEPEEEAACENSRNPGLAGGAKQKQDPNFAARYRDIAVSKRPTGSVKAL